MHSIFKISAIEGEVYCKIYSECIDVELEVYCNKYSECIYGVGWKVKNWRKMSYLRKIYWGVYLELDCNIKMYSECSGCIALVTQKPHNTNHPRCWLEISPSWQTSKWSRYLLFSLWQDLLTLTNTCGNYKSNIQQQKQKTAKSKCKNGHVLPTGQWYAPSAVINVAKI